MRPILAKILDDPSNMIFSAKQIELPYFSTEFHFHKECQLVYVVESEGKRIIGDSVETFQSDELILLGSDIPHVWHNDTSYFEKEPREKHARSIALFFNPETLLEIMKQFGPVNKLENFLNNAKRGIKYSGKTKLYLKDMLFQIAIENGIKQVITFLKIIDLMISARELSYLASIGYINTYQEKDNERIDKIFKYVFQHFSEEIQLDEAASLVNMNKQAFCRFFKSRTQKTFVNFVNEVRIGHACKLIAEGYTQISNLAYECGFNSITNFNHFFKEIKGITPSEYKKLLKLQD